MTTTTTTMKFSENEYINYQKKEGKKFETPELEHEWALTQFKTCTKCNTSKPLPDYMFHTKPLKMLCVKFVKKWEPEIMDLSLITATKRTSSEAIVAIRATEAWAFLETTWKTLLTSSTTYSKPILKKLFRMMMVLCLLFKCLFRLLPLLCVCFLMLPLFYIWIT